MGAIEAMREDWDRRAREDAYYYAGFGRRRQDAGEFFASGEEVLHNLTIDLVRLPEAPASSRRALEIGCGPGRLMRPMSAHFGEIHGVDISEEMAARARENLRGIPHARVHVTSGANLSPFPDEHFDYIYSFAVFQHIPDEAIVLNYLREARRTLKTGGVLCCQLRGAPPLPTELRRYPATWTGCYFTADSVAAFARETDFHLVALSGAGTHYMWTSWLKPSPRGPTDFSHTALKDVTPCDLVGPRITAGGAVWREVFSLWIDGLPRSCHLGNLEVAIRETRLRGLYLSPIGESGGCQLNVRAPRDLPPGPAPVQLYCDGRPIAAPRTVEIGEAPPRAPRVIAVSDGLDIESKRRIVMGGVKVSIEDLENPEEASFTVDGCPVEYGQFELVDSAASIYEFAFLLGRRTRLGNRLLRIRVSGRELPPIPIEIEALPSPAEIQQACGGQHGGPAQQAGDAPLRPAIVGERNLAGALARWLQRQKPKAILERLRRRRAPSR
ncbi:MAG TPA: class I SAM-dependent methyltransferase [Bryobacteraceae bacterium]|nr:class I SAM-dependent methyltransferase [Bryobacteraceae bacterium]